MKPYEELDHTADAGAIIYGRSLEELYQNAAIAYFDLICDRSQVSAREELSIQVEGEDYEHLLKNFLEKLLLLSQIQQFLLCQFQVLKLTPTLLEVLARGEKIDWQKHTLYTEVKAITYHMLKIWKEGGLYHARVIWDL